MTAPRTGGRSPVIVLAFVIPLLLAPFVFIAIIIAVGSPYRDDARPAKPASPCGLLRPELVDRLVPAAEPAQSESSAAGGAYESAVRCRIRSGEKGDTEDSRAYLVLELTRAGSADFRETPIDHARKDFHRSYRDTVFPEVGPTPVSDLGDEALAMVEERRRSEVMVTLQVRSGADIVTVVYYAEPADRDRVRDAAVAVAREVLSKL